MPRPLDFDARLSSKVWLLLKPLKNGDLRPVAASLSRAEDAALADLRLAGVDIPEFLVTARVPAHTLVDLNPDIPVYVGKENENE